MIPDIKLHEIVKACLGAIREDFAQNNGTPSDTILFHLLSTSKVKTLGKYNWYDQAVEIFINRDDNDPKYLDTRLFFDRERAAIPTIHIMVANESKGSDGIGIDLGFNDEQVIGSTQRPILNRQFNINANIVITSDNTLETIIVYHVIKSMIISLSTHIQLSGFINPTIGGGDITISQELVPNGIYARGINFSAGYELDVPEVVLNKIVSSVWVQMKSIEGETVVPIGPGPIPPEKPRTDGEDMNQ